MNQARLFLFLACLLKAPAWAQEDDAADTRLEELNVTAHRTEVRSVLPVETLNAEELAQRASRIGPGSLAPFTSLALSRAGAFGSQTQIRVRGAEANHLQVLIDGIEVNDPATGSEFAFAHLDLSGVGRIEFLPGAQSALWGSDALAGVLQLISPREASPTRVEVSAGSNRERFGGLDFGRKFSVGHYNLSLARYSTDGTNTSLEGNEDDGYEHKSAHFSSRLEGGNLGLSLVLRHLDALSEFDPTGFPTYLPVDGDNQSSIQQEAAKIALEARLMDGHLEHHLEIKHLRTRTLTDVEGARISRFEGGRDTLTSLSHLRIGERHLFTGLLEYEQERFKQAAETNIFGDPNYSETINTKSLALEYLAHWGRVSTTLSARLDTNSAFENIHSYRLAGRYFAGRDLSVFAGIGTGTKNPTFIERYGYTPDSFIGNPDLRPEYNRHASLGVDWHPSEATRVGLVLFDDELVDEINGFAWTGVGFTAVNLDGKSERRGLELRVQAEIQGNRLMGAYTWVDSNAPDGTTEVRRPRHQGHVSLTRTLLEDKLQLLFGARLQGKNLDLDFSTGQQRVVDLPRRELVYFTARYAFSDRLAAIMRVENALDDDGQEVYGFAPPRRAVSLGVQAAW